MYTTFLRIRKGLQETIGDNFTNDLDPGTKRVKPIVPCFVQYGRWIVLHRYRTWFVAIQLSIVVRVDEDGHPG